MKNKLYKYLTIFFLFIISFSCRNNDTEKRIIDELAIITKLKENDFYKNFFLYNIRPREEGRIYMIETESIREVWVNFYADEGVTFFRDEEEKVEKKLKTIYPTEYLKIKNKYMSDLNRLLNFMISNGIEHSVHVEQKKLFFGLINNTIIERDSIGIQNKRIESLKESYNDVRVVDSNWVIIKNPKYESKKLIQKK